ncbi:ribosomal protein S18-alanine N-acetyltransferase [Paenibacillus sp. 481]|uniref:ribosomal protein S18-alanine N-acetyltransferase n=1 Tax=Paenibacillus sp. 481 TaxID=2835869 RepID=UPI001E4A6A7E|nr:ribosomal protein S18-alanine N-acetyltransferase [Paenibacillus sp. 481]UHA76082.1 ribosomal protein S18-alanine N-acetyltransferase [Paenibacillus sp. 481]
MFRAMDIDDIPGVMTVEHASFTVPWSADAFRNEMLHNQNAKYIVMVCDEQIVGYAGMWTILDEAHITNIAIYPDYRGRGLGQQLLYQLMELAVYCGMVSMTLEVRVSNQAAQHLYTKFGFIAVGVRKGYYSDNQEDALIMWADLKQFAPIIISSESNQ